jgi:hypothetical protein
MSILAIFFGVACHTPAQPDQYSSKVSLVPEDLKWTPVPGDPEASRALVFGDPAKPGPYTYRVKFPPYHRVRSHTHPDNRTFTILKGTLYEAEGTNYDEAKLISYPAGSFFSYKGGTPFFSTSKEGEVILQTTGMGPTGISFVEK